MRRWLNLLCFLVHFTMCLVTVRLAWWRHGLNPYDHGASDHLMIRIFRITQIPSPDMIGENDTSWITGNFTTSDIRDAFYLRDNAEPVNFGIVVLSWFALSAAFHLLAVILGLFEVTWFIYWRQMVRRGP